MVGWICSIITSYNFLFAGTCPSPIPSPFEDCVITVSKEERQSGSKALGCVSTASPLFQNVWFFILRHCHLGEREGGGVRL
jgi:hypothetical protein